MNAEPTGTSISPVHDVDIAPVIALARATWYQHYPGIITVAQIDYMLAQRYQENYIRAQIDSGGAWWDKIEVDGRLAGFASYEPGARPDSVKLDKIYIHQRFQGRGLGSALLAHIERVSAQRGCDRVWLQVNKNNISSIAMYKRNGYRVAESVTFDIGLGFVMDDYIMDKQVGMQSRQNRDAGRGPGPA
jgi:ribosomal protein S18 acetylase RimI-like enzyme